MQREEMARLANIADAVRQSHTRSIPKDWQEPKHAHLLKAPSAFIDNVMLELQPNDSRGDPLPWLKTHRMLRLRPNEMTVWAGSNGSAKSTCLSEIMLSLASAGLRVVIVSLEMVAYRVVAKIVAQAFAHPHPTRKAVEAWADRLADSLCFLDFTGDITPAEVVKLARYCAHELNTQHMLIDNLTKIVSADNDHAEQQRLFMAQLHRTAIDTGVHIHLVAHTRKPAGDEERPPGRYEIAGSRTISDQPDNIVMMWRNRAKDQKIEKGDINAQSEPDVILRVDKQRHGRFEGPIKLWMKRDCYRFVDDCLGGIQAYAGT